MFYLVTLYVVGMQFGLVSILVTTVLLVPLWPINPMHGCARALLLLVILFMILSASVNGPVYEAAMRTQCSNHQRCIALGVLNFEASHMHFPQAFQTDEDGRPMRYLMVIKRRLSQTSPTAAAIH